MSWIGVGGFGPVPCFRLIMMSCLGPGHCAKAVIRLCAFRARGLYRVENEVYKASHVTLHTTSAYYYPRSLRESKFAREWKLEDNKENDAASDSTPTQSEESSVNVHIKSVAAEMYMDQQNISVPKDTAAKKPSYDFNFAEFAQLVNKKPDFDIMREVGRKQVPVDLQEDLEEDDSDEAGLAETESIFELYGGPDKSVPISDIPCAGCGANLHCQDPGIPGYMPGQRYKNVTKSELREMICQRCFMLSKHNVALDVSIDQDYYDKVLSTVKYVHGLVLVVVDMMDLPNSVYRKLPQLVGTKRPLYVVGNKIDLLPKDSQGYLSRAKQALVDVCKEAGLTKIKHLSLVSAKTGYGIEQLVTQLLVDWKGDVYILGCTNAGKSTLYNAMLSSDYCNSNARDFIHRATISTWPGTTLNLLKFPILKPVDWKLEVRARRLLKQRTSVQEEEQLRKAKLEDTGQLKYATLMGHIGYTFDGAKDKAANRFTAAMYQYESDGIKDTGLTRKQLDMSLHSSRGEYAENKFKTANWCFDTPGVINEEQVINLLSQEELAVILTSQLVQPRTILLRRGYSVFISGLARLDYIQGPKSIFVTIFASEKIPIKIVAQEKADVYYTRCIGSKEFGLPLGDTERLWKIPSLVGKQFELTGLNFKQSVADIVFSSIGWASITSDRTTNLQFRAYTPGGRGLHLRKPALLPYAVNLRGKKINTKSPKFEILNPMS